jgi:dienelactone hydrolase
LEYFGRAIGWLMQRPEVTPDEIAVVGGSRGGELALQLGSMYLQIKAVVAYVPANVRYPACCGGNSVSYAWTWNGKPLAYSFPRARMNRDTMKAIIEVEHTHGPILLISGEDDGVWESTLMAQAVVLRLKLEHFAYRVEHLKYPHAGHRAGNPEMMPSWHGRLTHPVSGKEIDTGGTPAGNALSGIDAAPKVIEFLRQSLQSADAGK